MGFVHRYAAQPGDPVIISVAGLYWYLQYLSDLTPVMALRILQSSKRGVLKWRFPMEFPVTSLGEPS